MHLKDQVEEKHLFNSMYVHAQTHTHALRHTYMHAHTHTHTCMHSCTHVCTRMHLVKMTPNYSKCYTQVSDSLSVNRAGWPTFQTRSSQ